MVVLAHPRHNLHRGQYSPDGRWLLFHVPYMGGKRSPMFVTPLVNGKGAPDTEWIPIQDGTYNDNSPFWSPAGGLVYFFSDRDGSGCVWAQRVERTTMRTIGEAFAVLHLHSSRQVLAPSAFVGPALTKDRLILALTETTGNIWIAEPR